MPQQKGPDKNKPVQRARYLPDLLRAVFPFVVVAVLLYLGYRLIRYGPSKLFSGGSERSETESSGTTCGFPEGCYCCLRDIGNGLEKYFDCKSNCGSEPTGTPTSGCGAFENTKCIITG